MQLVMLALILLMQRVETPSGVHLVYYLESADQPRIAVQHGSYAPPVSVQDSTTGQWRTTVAARLDPCTGQLQADGVTLAQQRCIWLPVVRK